MAELIVAVDETFGIGKGDKLPWSDRAEMKNFREKTMGRTLIMGRKTIESLPVCLEGRTILCLTSSPVEAMRLGQQPYVAVIKDLEETILRLNEKGVVPIVAGGRSIYKEVLTKTTLVDKIYLSIMKGKYDCDVYFEREWLDDFVIEESREEDTFTLHTMVRMEHNENQVINLMHKICTTGNPKAGRNGTTFSKFVNHLTFHLADGFPLLTTKKMFVRGIVEEFLFFMNGKTDTKLLEEKSVNIWKGNTCQDFLNSYGFKNRKSGDMGPMYGYQFRNFGAKYDEEKSGPSEPGIDQLKELIEQIKKDPNSRRHLMTSYNVAQAKEGVLYPCHSLILQFNVEGDGSLSLYAFNRSSDVFLGLPFNITYYALMLEVVARLTGKKAGMLHITLGDTHIYEDHMDQICEQIARLPYKPPQLEIKKKLESLEDLEALDVSDFIFTGYQCHSPIRAKMIA